MHDEPDDYEEDEEYILRRMITWDDDEPSFHVDLGGAVVCEDKMANILDAIEDDYEEGTQLMFRRGFVRELLAELRLKLLHASGINLKNDDNVSIIRRIPDSVIVIRYVSDVSDVMTSETYLVLNLKPELSMNLLP